MDKHEQKIRGRIKLFMEEVKEIIVISSFLIITVGATLGILYVLSNLHKWQ